MNKFYFTFLTLLLFSCGNLQENKQAGDPVTEAMKKPVENINATSDQRARRERSEAYCKSNNIPVYGNPNSLFVEPEEKVNIRTQDEVISRALALCYLGVKSEGLEQEYLDKLDKKYNISSAFTSNEKAYATSKHPTEQQKINANWKYEGLHVMLWALGYIDSLSYPSQVCNVGDDVKIIHELTAEQFSKKAKLRSKQEILDQADLILRLNWACVSARVKGQSAPANLEKGVVFERHYALNWLIKYMNQDWDDVSTDT